MGSSVGPIDQVVQLQSVFSSGTANHALVVVSIQYVVVHPVGYVLAALPLKVGFVVRTQLVRPRLGLVPLALAFTTVFFAGVLFVVVFFAEVFFAGTFFVAGFALTVSITVVPLADTPTGAVPNSSAGSSETGIGLDGSAGGLGDTGVDGILSRSSSWRLFRLTMKIITRAVAINRASTKSATRFLSMITDLSL